MLTVCSPLWRSSCLVWVWVSEWLAVWMTDWESECMKVRQIGRQKCHVYEVRTTVVRVLPQHYHPPYNLFPHPLSVAVIIRGKQKQLQLMKIRRLDARRGPEGKYRRRPPPLKRYAGDVLAPVIGLQFHTYKININIYGAIYLSNVSVQNQTDQFITHKTLLISVKLQPRCNLNLTILILQLLILINIFCNNRLHCTWGKLPENTIKTLGVLTEIAHFCNVLSGGAKQKPVESWGGVAHHVQS